MERDLLSCKHIGSSIENGLTKSIKADMAPIEGGGGGVCGSRRQVSSSASLVSFTFIHLCICIFSPYLSSVFLFSSFALTF